MANVQRFIIVKQADIPFALAMNFDIEGFTSFFKATQEKDVIEDFITRVFGLFNTVIHSGMQNQENAAYWAPTTANGVCAETIEEHEKAIGKEPDDLKFMGDGALYIWEFYTERDVQDYALRLVKRLLCFQTNFSKVVERFKDFKSLDIWRIRIGVASSPVVRYQVKTGANGSKERDEYLGDCLNLSSRLQGFCKKDSSKNINLVVSASNALNVPHFTSAGFALKTVKKGIISDCPDEPVYVPKIQLYSFQEAHKLFN